MKFKFTTPAIPLFDINKAKKLFGTEIKRALDTMSGETVKNVVMEAPRGTGELINHVKSERVNDVTARAFVDVDYGIVVEKGRRPNQTPPPYNPLKRWILSTKQGKSWFAAVQSKYKNITLMGAVAMLSKSIGKKGFAGNPFFNRGVTKTEKVYQRESEILLTKIMEGLA